MKNILLKTLFFSLLFFLLINIPLYSQTKEENNSIEIVKTICDRSFYIIDETIQFKAILLTIGDKNTEKSKILYLDLISPKHKLVIRKKLYSSDGKFSGCLKIPKTLLSGMYYLRAYTKYMRNFSQSNFSYNLIKIANPYNDEIKENNNTKNRGADSSNIFYTSNNELKIQLNKQKYSPKDSISIDILSSFKNPNIHYSLSIIPKCSYDSLKIPNLNLNKKNNTFSKEDQGFIISGQLLYNNKKKALTEVYLSNPQEKNIIPTISNQNGFFEFYIGKKSGKETFYLSSNQYKNDSLITYHLDNDFANIPSNLPFPKFQLNKEEQELALKMAQNIEIQELYSPKKSKNLTVKKQSIPFYGRKFKTIFFDDYILLGSTKNYFTEIDLPIKLITINDKKEFRVKGIQADLAIFPPLLMLDGVQISEATKILSISPKSLDKIELIDSAYIKGNGIFGGIIHFFSRNNDFGGIELPSSIIKFDYQFLPGETTDNEIKSFNSKIPDTRNTLYWNPSVKIDNNKPSHISIRAAQTKGKYLVVLKGIDQNGKEISNTAQFEIQ